MQVKKSGRAWVVEGEGKGWIFGRTFPRKFKAEIALEVFKKGGNKKDYLKKCCKYAEKRIPIEPVHKIEALENSLKVIRELSPTCEEIEEYAEGCPHGVVTITKGDSYFGPRLHNTWGKKSGGRVHIDIGCRGYHLMLDKDNARGFVDFVRKRRGL